MKQETIIRNKLWDAIMNKKSVAFPIEFYSQLDVLKGINGFDLHNVDINFRFGKTDKGFEAYIVSFPKKEEL